MKRNIIILVTIIITICIIIFIGIFFIFSTHRKTTTIYSNNIAESIKNSSFICSYKIDSISLYNTDIDTPKIKEVFAEKKYHYYDHNKNNDSIIHLDQSNLIITFEQNNSQRENIWVNGYGGIPPLFIKPLNDTIPPDTLELYLTNDPFKNKDISIFGKIYLSINSK
ncbi:MAG: hypothetical protein IKJ52_03515 [Muribaculaceae bacterium]|nr:hypothetical protein [Muribaculaceae bacterium]